MVVCGGWEMHQKVVVAPGGHRKAYGMEKKLSMLRGMMMVLSRTAAGGER